MRYKGIGPSPGKGIYNFLLSLGKTPVEVANSLKAMGIKGKRCNSKDCPIVNAVYYAFPRYWTGLHYYPSNTETGTGCFQLEDSQIMNPKNPPVAVSQFARRFDAGDFDSLVDKT